MYLPKRWGKRGKSKTLKDIKVEIFGGKTKSKEVIRAVGRDTEEWITEPMKSEFREGQSSQWLNTAESEMIGFGLPTVCSHFRTFSLQGRNWKADFSRWKRIQWMSKWNRMSYWWNYKLSLILRETKPSLTQSCPTLCDPVGCSPPRSSVHGIFQARVLEWAAISFSRQLTLVFFFLNKVFTEFVTILFFFFF